MCTLVYVGSDAAIPDIRWIEGKTVLSTEELTDQDAGIRPKFTKPEIKLVGAWEGCGCGFEYGILGQATLELDETDLREEELGKSSVCALRQLLKGLLEHQETVELYACYEGDQDKEIQERMIVSPDFFGGDIFELGDRILYLVSNAA